MIALPFGRRPAYLRPMLLRALILALSLSFVAVPAQAQFWNPFGGYDQRPSRPKPQPQVPALPKSGPMVGITQSSAWASASTMSSVAA